MKRVVKKGRKVKLVLVCVGDMSPKNELKKKNRMRIQTKVEKKEKKKKN